MSTTLVGWMAFGTEAHGLAQTPRSMDQLTQQTKALVRAHTERQ